MITLLLSRCYSVFFILALSLALSACGGGGGSSTETGGSGTNYSTRTGVFSDSPVSGLTYSFNSEFYKTNNAGTFQYSWNDTLDVVAAKTSFYLGGFLLGEVSGKPNVTPLDIFGATSTSDPRVVNLLRLLQTLDNDDDPSNGIEISPSVQEQFTQSLNINWAHDIFSNDSPITTILDTAKPGVSIVSAENAVAHFIDQISELPEIELFSVGGNSSGLIGNVELEINGDNSVTVTPLDSTFSFDPRFTSGATYSVTIKTISASQTCELQNQAGTISNSDINGVSLTCSEIVAAEEYQVGGSVANLNGSLSIRNNTTSEALTLTTNGAFSFNTLQMTDSFYNVSIVENPANQTCVFTPLSSAMGQVLQQDISSITISCTDNVLPRYTVSGSIAGLNNEQSVSLSLNGGQASIFTGNSFTFPEHLLDGESYSVNVTSKPSYYTCRTENAQGVIDGSGISLIEVNCSHDVFNIGGQVTGHQGLVSISLNENGTATKQTTVAISDASFVFEDVLDGTEYAISAVIDANTGQTCQVANASATLAGSHIVNANVVCSDIPSYAIGGNLEGLSGTLVLRNNSVDNLTITTNGSFEFGAKLQQGESYAVEIVSQPASQDCSISTGSESGTVQTTAISSIAISCSDKSFNVQAAVAGHSSNLSLVLIVDGQAQPAVLIDTQEAAYDFGQFAYNSTIDISATAPEGQNCQITNGSSQGLMADLSASIICTDIITHSVSTTVSGLPVNETLNVVINGLSAQRPNGTMSQNLVDGDTLVISVSSFPEGYSCPVSEYISPVSADQNVTIVCSQNTYEVSGTVVGLQASDQISILFSGQSAQSYSASNNTFSFTLTHGSSFALSSDDSLKYDCGIDGGDISSVTSAVNNVVVTCDAPTYTVSGSISSHTGIVTVTYDDQYGEPISQQIASGTSSFEFTGLYNGAQFQVTSSIEQSANQSCTGSNTSNTINGQDISNISIECSNDPSYSIGGTITGLARGSVTLVNTIDGSETDVKAFSNAGIFVMSQALFAGQNYDVSVQSDPSTQTCSVISGGQGQVSGAIQNIVVECLDVTQHTITTTIQGLENTDVISVSIDGGIAQSQGNGSIQTLVYEGQGYSLAVSDVPDKYTCTPLSAVINSVTQNETITVICAVKTFAISGSVTGLGVDTVNLTFSGQTAANYTNAEIFSFVVAYGSDFSVSDSSDKYDCILSGGDLQNILSVQSNVLVTCDVNELAVSVSVTGLDQGDVLNLLVNGSQVNISGSANEIIVPYGSPLQVSGVISAKYICGDFERGIASVTADQDYLILCGGATYSIQGQVLGLADLTGVQVELEIGGSVARQASVAENGSYSFSDIAYQSAVSVGVISGLPINVSCQQFDLASLESDVAEANLQCGELFQFSGSVTGHKQTVRIVFDSQRFVDVPISQSNFTFSELPAGSSYSLSALDENGQTLLTQVCEFTLPDSLPLSGQLNATVADVLLNCKTPISPDNFVSSLLYDCVRENLSSQNEPYLFVEDFPAEHTIRCGIDPLAAEASFNDLTGIEILAGSNVNVLYLNYQEIPDTELYRLYSLIQLEYLGMAGTHARSDGAIVSLEVALPFTVVGWQDTSLAFAKYFSMDLSFSETLKASSGFGYMSLLTFNWYNGISQFVRPLSVDTSRTYNYAGGVLNETVTFDFSPLESNVNCRITNAYDDSQNISCDVLGINHTISVQVIGSSESPISLLQSYKAGPYSNNTNNADDFFFIRNTLLVSSDQQVGLLDVSDFNSNGFLSDQGYFEFVLESLKIDPYNDCLLIKPDISTISQISDINLTVNCDIGPTTLLVDLGMSAELYNCVSQNGALTTIGDVGSNLSCTYQGITNLNGIQYLSQLEKLNLQSNSIPQSEMSYLYDLDSLTLLNLAGNDLVIDNTLVNELEEALPFTAIRYTDTDVGSSAGSALVKIDVRFSPESLVAVADPGLVTLITPYWGGINCDSENIQNCVFRNVERSFSENYSRVHEVNYDSLNDIMISNPDYLIDQSALNEQLECSAFSSSIIFTSTADATIYIQCGLKSIRDISGSVTGSVYGYIPPNGLVIEAYLDNVKVTEITLGDDPTEYYFADINEGFYQLRLSPNDTLCSIDNSYGYTSGTISNANLSCGQIKNVVSDSGLVACLEGNNEFSNSISSVGTSVDCSYSNISDLDGIQFFTQIRELTLTGNNLENEDFDTSTDPIYSLKNNLDLLDINGNYGIRLTSICDGTIPNNLPFTVVRNSDLNCAGPDRTIDIDVNVSNLVANYFTDFGTAYLRGVRLHGWSSDTFNVSSSALTDSFDSAYFSNVRDGSSARLEFDHVRPSLDCFNNSYEVTRNISTSEECTAKQLVDINVTLDGGGYDITGRETDSVSGLELIYQRDYPYTDNFISSIGSDWTPGNDLVFFDFPSDESDVSVEPGYNYSFFNAPDFVYCSSTDSKTIGFNHSDRSFVVPCSQSYVYGTALPASVEPVSEYADERVNYSLHLESGTDNQQMILDLELASTANIIVTKSTSNTNIATVGSTSLTRLKEWTALAGQSSVNFEGFTESGTYWISLQNTDASAENLYSLGMQLANIGHSSQVSLRPLKLIQPVYTRTWQQTLGNSTFPEDRLNNSYDRLVVRPINGSGQLATASVKITLTSAVDTYLILTTDSGAVMAVSDDAGGTNRSVIFKDLAPGSYNVIPTTYSEVNTPTDYVLTYESSMPAFTYLD